MSRARFPSPKTGFCCGISNFGVLPHGCQFFTGGTTGFHHDAARNFAGRDLHTSARTSESFGRSESGSHEPDHQSTQSAPVPTQCRRRANFRAAPHVRASNGYNKACEVRRRRRGCWNGEACPMFEGNWRVLPVQSNETTSAPGKSILRIPIPRYNRPPAGRT